MHTHIHACTLAFLQIMYWLCQTLVGIDREIESEGEKINIYLKTNKNSCLHTHTLAHPIQYLPTFLIE